MHFAMNICFLPSLAFSKRQLRYLWHYPSENSYGMLKNWLLRNNVHVGHYTSIVYSDSMNKMKRITALTRAATYRFSQPSNDLFLKDFVKRKSAAMPHAWLVCSPHSLFPPYRRGIVYGIDGSLG